MALSDELRKLMALRDSGELSAQEYDVAKSRALAGQETGTGWMRRKPVLLAAGAALVLTAVATSAAIARTDDDPSSGIAAPSSSPSPSPSLIPSPSPSPSPSPLPTPAPSSAPNEAVAAPPTTAATGGEPVAGDMQVLETGWSRVFDGDYAVWGAVVRNNTTAFATAEVSATALDASGAPIDSSPGLTVVIPPGTSLPLGSAFLKTVGMKSVEVTASLGSTREDLARIGGTVDVKGVVRGVDEDSSLSFTLKNGLSVGLQADTPLTAVFRNASGKIVGGGSHYIPAAVAAGGSSRFAINTGGAFIAPDSTKAVEAAVPYDSFNLRD